MLSYALAIAVGLSSLILFSTAFLMSDIHRQDDFFWSGVGLFYALVLWFCATRITGSLLLGQTAAVALLISYHWQTLKLRKAIAHPEQAEELNKFSVLAAINGLFARGASKPQAKLEKSVQPTVIDEKITIPETPSTDVQSESTVATEEIPAAKEAMSQSSTSADKVAQKRGLFGKFFGGKKQKSPKSSSDKLQSDTSSITNTKLNDLLDEEPSTEEPQAQTISEAASVGSVTEEEATSDTVAEITPEAASVGSVTEEQEISDTVAETVTDITDITEKKAIASKPESTEISENITIQPQETSEERRIETTENPESQESNQNSDEKSQDS
ncbi:MAG: Ycf66 family protein [Pleurocapsa sp.]